MAEIEVVTPTRNRELDIEAAAIESVPPVLQKAEIYDIIAKRGIATDLQGENHRRAIPAEIQAKALSIMDDICKEVGHPTLSRRILERNNRIASAVESHIYTKKNKEFEKKCKIEGNVQEQKGIKNTQALWTGSGGIASLAFSALGLLPSYGELFRNLANLPDPFVRAITTSYDGKLTPLSHEQQFFLNNTQSEKQAIESLKNLPEQLRQLILELMRLEHRAIESISQR